MATRILKPSAKRILTLFLILLTVLVLYPTDFAFAEIDISIFDGGSGTADDPWQIRTLEQLKNFCDSTNGTVDRITGKRTGNESYEGKSIKLTADIDLGSIQKWTPIARWSDFKGTFDGNGHKITNLSVSGAVDSIYDAYLGFFGRVYGKITNLSVSGSVSYGTDECGGIAAELLGGTIENCYSNIAVNAGQEGTGGIVGYVARGGTVKNCHTSASVSGVWYTGGIVGDLSDGTVENCYNEASVYGSSYTGGIVGRCNGGTVRNCYNKNSVGASSNELGGVVGELTKGVVTSCYNTGAVSGNGSYDVGGVVGFSGQDHGSKTSCYIENCYNTGAVSASRDIGNTIGGVVGFLYVGILKNCYNTGTITEPANRGRSGVCGNDGIETLTEIKNCYYLKGVATRGTYEYEDTVGRTECKTEAKFKSGEVTWLMQNGQGSKVWGQCLANGKNRDAYPLLTSAAEKKVYRVAFMSKSLVNNGTYTSKKTYYVNSGTTVKAPELSSSTAYADAYWAEKDNRETPFDETVPIESDMTLYAIGREILQATSESDTVKLTTGQEVTVDLNKYVENKSGNSKNFSFEFVEGFLPHGMEHSGSAISGTPTEPGTYFAFFKVTNNGGLALMSLDEENDYLCLDFIVSAPKTLISNYEELEAFRDSVSEDGKTYEGEVVMLTADIDMYDPIGLTGNKYVWQPIGRDYRPFMGTFDGNGHKLTNLYFEGTSDYRGLFGYTGESAVIKNLTVSGSVSTSNYVGGIVAYNNGTIENCRNDVTVTASGDYAGGVAGYNCGTITDCSNTNTVSGSANSSYIGGITGFNGSNNRISKCYNTGDVSRSFIVGGIAGNNFGEIANCYNTGTVNGASLTGGIAGRNLLAVTYCYNAGTVTGGGIVGGNDYHVGDCFYLNGSCSVENNVGHSITTEELSDEQTFRMVGWDFDTVWYMGDKSPLLIAPDFTPDNDSSSGSDSGSETDPDPDQDEAVFCIMGPNLDEETLNVTIDCGEGGLFIVIFAHYADDALDKVAYTELPVYGPNQEYVEIQDPEFLLTHGDKIFLVRDLESMKPLCEAYTVCTETE